MAGIADILNTPINQVDKIFSVSKADMGDIMGVDIPSEVDANTKLLLHFNNSYDDSSTSTHSVTNVNNTFSDTIKKFGSYSTYFTGSSHLELPDSDDWAFGSGDFTIDFWYRFSEDTYSYFVGQYAMGDNNNNSMCFVYRPDTHVLELQYSTTGSNYANISSASWTPTLDTWYHIAYVRSSETLMFFIDGQLLSSSTLTATFNNSTRALMIGYNNYNFSTGGHWYPHGYMDELRISKGIARWTSAFTPPTSEY